MNYSNDFHSFSVVHGENWKIGIQSMRTKASKHRLKQKQIKALEPSLWAQEKRVHPLSPRGKQIRKQLEIAARNLKPLRS